MNILVISYGDHQPGACLITGHGGRYVSFESDHYADMRWDRVFPDNSIAEVMKSAELGAEDLDWIAFCGKPFMLLERLVNLHVALFPRHFGAFISDLRDFFTQKFRVRSLLKKKLGYRGRICYPSVMDAAAIGAAEKDPAPEVTVIVSMEDTLEAKALSVYRASSRGLFEEKELAYPNSLSLLEKGASARTYPDGSFVLSGRDLSYSEGRVMPRTRRRPCGWAGKDGLLAEALRRLIDPERQSPGQRISLVSDHQIPQSLREELTGEIPGLSFHFMDRTDKIGFVADHANRCLRGQAGTRG